MGIGWHHDPLSLRPVLDDERSFRAAYADDVAIDAVVSLFDGRPHDAELQLRELLAGDPHNRRLIALLADARRDQGHYDEAEATYRGLIDTEHDGLRRAAFVQHLGKTLYAAGRLAEAAACFSESLAARRALGADADQLASSELALRAASRRAT